MYESKLFMKKQWLFINHKYNLKKKLYLMFMCIIIYVGSVLYLDLDFKFRTQSRNIIDQIMLLILNFIVLCFINNVNVMLTTN